MAEGPWKSSAGAGPFTMVDGINLDPARLEAKTAFQDQGQSRNKLASPDFK